jgi:hypothetical protein
MKSQIKIHRLRFLAIIIISLQVFTQGNSQELNYKYHLGTTSPDTNWYKLNFDDASWSDGQGSIGYGDMTYPTAISTTPSVYLRYKFKINNILLSQLTALIINADFDDGYIAYLNGKELYRVNMDTNSNPGNLQIALRSHESIYYRDNYADFEGFFIDSLLLDSSHMDTTNVLAFEVHNDSVNGSDLSFTFKVTPVYNYDYYYNYWDSRYIRPISLDSLDIPIVLIETDEYGYNFNSSKPAHMGIIRNKSGHFNKLIDSCNDYNGRINIKGRGETSEDSPKPSFKIELQDSAGNNNNTKILGLPKENDFVLYGPCADQSLIHNTLVFKLGRKMGPWNPRTRYCELILNGRDMGLYVMTESIKRDDNRVNIAKITSTDNEGFDVTGGYIFRWDKGYSESAQRAELIYPDQNDLTLPQEDYIYDYYHHIDSLVNSNGFIDPSEGYQKYINVKSLIDYVIINELTMNVDAYYYSSYMFKDRDDIDGKLNFGPLWDYDFTMGYSLWGEIPTTGWRFDDPQKIPKFPLLRILQDTSFVNQLVEQWHNYRQTFLKTDSIFNLVDSIILPIQSDIDRNYLLWPSMGKMLWQSNNSGKSYPDEISKMENWLIARLSWMDENIDKIYKPIEYNNLVYPFDPISSITCYPNVFKDNIIIKTDSEISGELKVEVYNILGVKQKEVILNFSPASQLEQKIDMADLNKAGVYLIKISIDNKLQLTQRVIKMN